jgi:hypothetical protein
MSDRVYYNSALSWKKHNTGDNRIIVGNTVGTPFEKSDFVSPTSIKAVPFTSSNMKSYLCLSSHLLSLGIFWRDCACLNS